MVGMTLSVYTGKEFKEIRFYLEQKQDGWYLVPGKIDKKSYGLLVFRTGYFPGIAIT